MPLYILKYEDKDGSFREIYDADRMEDALKQWYEKYDENGEEPTSIELV